MLVIETFAGLSTIVRGAGGFLLGALVGSYFATVLARWPRGESANRGRSRCDGCSRQLEWFELLPMVSQLALRGRCRTCGVRIDRLHILTELAFALVTAALFALQMPLWAPLAWLLIVLGTFDALYLWLPDRLTFPLALLALAMPALDSEAGIGERVVTGAVVYAAITFVAAVFRRLTGRVGLGGGDAKLLAALALWAGPLQIPAILLLACLIGLADTAIRVAGGRVDRNVQLPLGSYLCLATLGYMLLAAVRGAFA